MTAAPSILQREKARSCTQENIGEVLNGFRDIVDEGTNLLARVNQTLVAANKPRPAHLALLLLFRHVVELADAVDELYRAGCFVPAGLQLRAIVEARMQMLYLLGRRVTIAANPLGPEDVDPTPRDAGGKPLVGSALKLEQDKRGLAYTVLDLRRQLHSAESHETAELTRRMQELTGRSTVPPNVTTAEVQAGLAAEIVRLKGELARPEFASINAEFERVRGNVTYDRKWYGLWKGPSSVNKLARSVGLAFDYETLYSVTSRTMHGTNYQAQIGPANASGDRAIGMLRQGKNLDEPINAFVLHMIQIYELVISELRPAEHEVWSHWVQRWKPLVQT